jgi:hypothetical protein
MEEYASRETLTSFFECRDVQEHLMRFISPLDCESYTSTCTALHRIRERDFYGTIIEFKKKVKTIRRDSDTVDVINYFIDSGCWEQVRRLVGVAKVIIGPKEMEHQHVRLDLKDYSVWWLFVSACARKANKTALKFAIENRMKFQVGDEFGHPSKLDIVIAKGYAKGGHLEELLGMVKEKAELQGRPMWEIMEGAFESLRENVLDGLWELADNRGARWFGFGNSLEKAFDDLNEPVIELYIKLVAKYCSQGIDFDLRSYRLMEIVLELLKRQTPGHFKYASKIIADKRVVGLAGLKFKNVEPLLRGCFYFNHGNGIWKSWGVILLQLYEKFKQEFVRDVIQSMGEKKSPALLLMLLECSFMERDDIDTLANQNWLQGPPSEIYVIGVDAVSDGLVQVVLNALEEYKERSSKRRKQNQ